MSRAAAYLVSVLLLTAVTAPAQVRAKELTALSTVQLFFENDLFGRTDKYYTNAVQLAWVSPALESFTDDPRVADPLIRLLKYLPLAELSGSSHNIGLLLGHQIYTPADIRETALQPADRPYAGYLYAGMALHSKTDNILDTLEASIGIVGPDANAEFAQNRVHEIRDIPTAKGWDNQLHNEPTLQLSWQRKWREEPVTLVDAWGGDLIWHAGATLGNVRIAGHAGAEFRLGYNLPMDFGSDVIRAGAGVSTPAMDRDETARGKETFRPFGMHLFGGVHTEAVLHDIFLDGNTFEESHSVEKEHLFMEFSAGIALNWDRYKFTYRHFYRTRQFEGQAKDQFIGSITFTVSF